MTFKYEKQLAALEEIFKTAEARLSLKIEQDLASGRLGTAAYRTQQLTQIQQYLVDLNAATSPRAVAILQAAYAEGTAVASVAGVEGAFASIHDEAINVLANSMTNRLGDALTTVGRQVEDIYRREGVRQAALALAEGGTRAEASQAMIEALRDQAVTGFTDRAGRPWGLDRYTEMVLRTTTREATSEGTRNRLLEGGIDLVEWSGNGENCPECQALDGTVFSLTGATDGYDVLEILPPLHPNCTCVLTPASVTFEELERELQLA